MKVLGKLKKILPFLLLFAVLIAGSSALFVFRMKDMTDRSTLNTVQELSSHDEKLIENYLNQNWIALSGIAMRMKSYHFSSISEAQAQLALERFSGEFETIYLLADDDVIYTDRSTTFTKEERDIRPCLSTNENNTACRFNYQLSTMERKEVLLFAVPFRYEVDGIRFTHLAGITPISRIRDKMILDSFFSNGEPRGFTSVIDLDGGYVVNIDRTVNVNIHNNLYDELDNVGRDAVWSNENIRKQMEAGNTFRFECREENGQVRFLYFTPVKGVAWYMVVSVEQAVFSELSRAFTYSALTMVLIAVMISVIMLVMSMRSRQKELSARASSEARMVFLSNMSHEIRTPLNGITGLLHLIETDAVRGDTQQLLARVGKAKDTTGYLLSLVSDILDMSRLQANKLKLENAPLSLPALLGSIETMQQSNAAGRGVELILHTDLPCPCVMGDEVRIKQVLMNIVGNAVKFTPAGGQITLNARQTEIENCLVTTIISCTDTGVGMSEDFQKHIWDSFTQEHNKVSDGTRGTGLGMSISKGIMDAMGGRISVDSKLGEGSTFTVTFRALVADLPTEEATPVAADTAEDQPMKLLVAEDNALNAEILMEILESEGHKVVLAEDGKQAVEAFQNSAADEFDAILMDMQMPVMDGCAAATAIRALDRPDAATVPIFACTANAFQEDRDRALASGMNDFLTKPVDIDELFTKLHSYHNRKD